MSSPGGNANLARIGRIMAIVSISAAMVTLALIVVLTLSLSKLRSVEDSKFYSYLLADEMRQSSDDLTRLARTYAVTGDPRYEEQYNRILAIRHGEAERPIDYHRPYWDFVAAGRPVPEGSGVTKSLEDLMKEAGFKDSELGLLQKAVANSEGLVGLEVKAMNAVKGLFADENGEYTVAGVPNNVMATQLLHSREYHQFKADIVGPVNEFLRTFEERFNASLVVVQRQALLAEIGAVAAAIVSLLSAIASFFVLKRRFLGPIAALRDAMVTLGKGGQIEVPCTELQDEMGDMARETAVFKAAADETARLGREVEEASRVAKENAEKQAEAAQEALEMAEREKGRLEQERQTAIHAAQFQNEVQRVVAQAVEGNLDARIEIDTGYDVSVSIGGQINEMLAVVDGTFAEIGSGLDSIARGDLSHVVDAGRSGRYGQVLVHVDTARQALADTVAATRSKADEVSGLSDNINSAMSDLSQRTTNSAATLEETSAALTELSESVRSASDGAQQADRLVVGTKSQVESSNEIVNRAVEAMRNIEQSSGKIADIIDVIDDIAFQTNLLALNAGVEAARAGDAGRGFTVVASEVRALAQRSSEAASEITDLISQSTSQVAVGVDLVGEADKTLKEVVSSIVNIAAGVSDIATSAKEQSIAIGEITTAVQNLDNTTQMNASMVFDISEVGQSLNQSAGALIEQVSGFVIAHNAGTPAVFAGRSTVSNAA